MGLSPKRRWLMVVRALDGLVAEAQVADGDAAGLLGVILEVGLDILVGVVADDLDGVLVRADGAVAAEAPEHAAHGALRRGVGRVGLTQRELRDVVHDADGEAGLRIGLGQLLVDGKDARRRSVLGGEAVAAADDLDVGPAGVGQARHDVHVQGLAQGAGLLRAVEHSDGLTCRRDGGQQLVRAPGPVQPDLHEADLLAVGVQVVDDFLGHVADGAHRNDDAVGVRGAVVVEQLVIGAELLVDLLHVVLDYAGDGLVILVRSLAVLEEDVAVLVAAAHLRMLGVQGAGAELLDGLHVAHRSEVLVIPDGDLLNLVRGTEAVKEVQEGDAALDGGEVGDGGEVHDLLDVALAEHGKAGLAAGHDVLMVAEDRQGVAREGTGGDVEYAGQQLARYLVHVRDHEQQALGRGISRRQSAGIQRAVHRTGGAGLGLHLLHLHRGAEDVLQSRGRPLVNKVRHRAGRRDRVDRGHLSKSVRNVRRGLVAVHGLEFSRHTFISTQNNSWVNDLAQKALIFYHPNLVL